MKSWLAVNLLRFLSTLSFSLLAWLGRGLGHVVWWLNDRSRKLTEKNIKRCYPHLSAAEQLQLAQKSIQQLAILVLEMGPAWYWPPAKILPLIKEVEGLAILEGAENIDRGTIIIVPHLGNWEVLGVFLGAHGKVTSMYQPQSNARIDAMIYAARQRTGNTLVPTNTRGVKSLLKALKAGETVVVLPDQTPADGSGEFAPFFGQATYTMTLIYNLIQRTGARAITAVAERVATGDFRVVLADADEAIYSQDLLTSLTALNRSIERSVQRCPEQYQWEYNRFKKLPKGSEPQQQG